MRNLLFLVFIAINSGIHTSAQTRTLTVVVDNLSNLPQTDVPVAVALPHDIRVRSANLVPSQNGNGIFSASPLDRECSKRVLRHRYSGTAECEVSHLHFPLCCILCK